MMRKLGVLFLLLLVCFSLYSFDYKLDLISFTPLYKEYDADDHRAAMDFQYAAVYEGYPDYIYQDYHHFDFVDYESVRMKPFVGVYHVGETLSLVKNTFTFDSFLSPIAFDFAFQGSLTGVMEGEMADIFGYDGEFFYGLTMSIADVVSLRFGGSHYCSQ